MVPHADLALVVLTVRGSRKLLKTLVPEAGSITARISGPWFWPTEGSTEAD